MTVTARDVREAMEANGITYVEHHDCTICGYMTNYHVVDGELYFDPGCYCTRADAVRRASFQDAADWINMQDNEDVRRRLAEKFGLSL